MQSEGSGGQETPGSSWGAHPSLPGGPALTTGLRPMARSGFQQQHPGKGLQHTTLLLYPRPREGKTDRRQEQKHPLLCRFASRRPLGVVLQVGLLLGLHFQDALHVVLVGELRGASAQRNHALRPDRRTGSGSLPMPQPPGQTHRLSGPSPRPSPADRQTGSWVLPHAPAPRQTDRLWAPPQAPAQLPEASTFSAPPSAASTSLSREVV